MKPGQRFVVGTYKAGNKERSPLIWRGTTVVNGEPVERIRGPHFDMLYTLADYYKFSIEAVEGGLKQHKPGLISGVYDIINFGFMDSHDNFHTFQIGR